MHKVSVFGCHLKENVGVLFVVSLIVATQKGNNRPPQLYISEVIVSLCVAH